MSERTPPSGEEIVATLRRMGVKGFDEAFVARCVALNAVTQRTLSMLPPPPDKAVEASHIFAPPLTRK